MRDITDPGLAGRYDLVAGFEMLHDLARPIEALAAMRRLLADRGTVLIVDERVAERFTQAAMAERHIELYERIRGTKG